MGVAGTFFIQKLFIAYFVPEIMLVAETVCSDGPDHRAHEAGKVT